MFKTRPPKKNIAYWTVYNHWLISQSLNTGPCHENRGKCEFQRIRGLYREFECGKFGVARVLPWWPLLKPLVVTIFQKLAELMKEYRVIEEKWYDSRTLEKTKRAWLEVLDKFNAEFLSTPTRALRWIARYKTTIYSEKKYQHMPCSSAKIKFMQSDLPVLFSHLGRHERAEDQKCAMFITACCVRQQSHPRQKASKLPPELWSKHTLVPKQCLTVVLLRQSLCNGPKNFRHGLTNNA